jgi:hypothetical protein
MGFFQYIYFLTFVVRRKIWKMSKNWKLEIIMSQGDDSLLLKYDIKKAFLKEKSSLSIFAKKNSKKCG